MTLNLSLAQMGTAAVLILITMALSTWQRLGLTKSLLIGALRATAQLTLMGYVLVTVFESTNPWLVGLLVVVMSVIAARTAASRQKEAPQERSRIFWYATFSILLSTGFTLVFVTQCVLYVEPWYSAQYVIPMGGMIISNSMNAAALGAERFASEFKARRPEVETLLAMGASPKIACWRIVRRAIAASMMPTISGLMVVGLVSIPGMMSGQILSGVSPLLAIRYQLVVQFMIACAAAITSMSIVMLYGRSFFDHKSESLHVHRLIGR